ncbi:GNAT family N-acetyltransferase [Streptomyces sp. OF3]|uniref:GNAT family N-acetyltransferase n=1 Tax=Streptomyces alkaliterrae TaxID=2213162 RepID=A0A7W3ZMT5_9ACTN|nr:GNAT family N-acetyltransferase [Streptomyces alkaliterrae]MBB1253692.1 GNAT family N-acetyltransferase [Streptomyces alkaliterrae]
MIIRPVQDTAKDAEAVRALAEAAFGDDGRAWPAERVDRHHRRTRHLARTDPTGCLLAEDSSGRPLGAVLSTRREGTWGLSLLVVHPDAQGGGLGRTLLDAALEHGKACLRALLCSSGDPAAARLYRRAGFDLHPAMRLRGTVDADGLAPPDGPVAPGSAGAFDLLDSVDRRLRGGAHGPDHRELLRDFRLLVCDDLAGSGYCYVTPDGPDVKVELLAATSRRLASRLLTAALLTVEPGARVRVDDLTAEQQWAVDVGLDAGLRVENGGYVCVRGMRPPAPYIPSGAYL